MTSATVGGRALPSLNRTLRAGVRASRGGSADVGRATTLQFAVLSDPVAMPRPRVVTHRGRAHGYIPTAAARACWEIRMAAAQALGDLPQFTGPVQVTIAVYLRQPGNIPKRDRVRARPTRRPDADNFAKTALDGLSVLWRDDAQVTDLIVRKYYAVDSAPMWEIRVEEAAHLEGPRNGPRKDR